jgi:hypothetical protein
MGNNSLKMYDEFSKILRIETTSNDVSFFKHYRKVEHKNGTSSMKIARMKKNLYSLAPLLSLMNGANKCYLDFISAFTNNEIGHKRLDKLTKSQKNDKRTYKGFNLFSSDEIFLLENVLRGEFNISGFRNRGLRRRLTGFSPDKISRLIKRLHVFGLIKKPLSLLTLTLFFR